MERKWGAFERYLGGKFTEVVDQVDMGRRERETDRERDRDNGNAFP